MPNNHITLNTTNAGEVWGKLELHLKVIAVLIASVEDEDDKAKIGLNAIAGLVGFSAQQIFHNLDDGVALAPMVRAVMDRLELIIACADADVIGPHTIRTQ